MIITFRMPSRLDTPADDGMGLRNSLSRSISVSIYTAIPLWVVLLTIAPSLTSIQSAIAVRLHLRPLKVVLSSLILDVSHHIPDNTYNHTKMLLCYPPRMTLLDEYRRAFSSPVNPMPDNHAIVPQLSDEQTSEAGYGAPNPGEEPKIAGSRPELIDLTSKERPGGEHPSITPTDQFKRPRTDVGRFNDYALRYVRKLNKDGDHILTELVIGSPFIQQALRSILSSYSFLNLAADPIVIPKPFAPLFHYREELEEYTRSAERTDVEATHMRALMNEFFKLYMEDTRRIFTEEVPKGRVRFEYLWTLFRAEDDIIVHNEYFREMHRVVHCEVTITNAGRKFNIYTWRWGYNAGKFGPCAETIIIHEFASTRRIQQLSCFPVKLLLPEEQAKLNQDLIDRGRQWRQLISPKQRLYNGL